MSNLPNLKKSKISNPVKDKSLTGSNRVSEYDLIIVGAGPGGYVAALYAAQNGLKTCLVEKEKIGGICLNAGCIPTKSLYASVRLLSEIKEADKFGIKVGDPRIDPGAVYKRKNDIVKTLRRGVEALLKARKIDVKSGSGRLADKNTVSVGGESVKAKYIIIATGSRPVELPFMRFDRKYIVSSAEMLDAQDIPERIVVIGGGAIGCEFAGIFNGFGSHVTIIEMMENLIPANDPEIAKRLQAALKRKGVEVFTKTKVKSCQITKRKDLILEIEGASNNKIACQKALICVGRRPNVEEVGLEETGIKASAKGIEVDKDLRTNVDNIFAIGDVIGGYMLAHAASYEGILACDNIMGRSRAVDYSAVPFCIFTDPDVASVGVNEAVACERNLEVDIVKLHFRSLGKAHALGKIDGMIKMVSDKSTGKVLGVDIIGEAATDLIAEATLAVKMGVTLEDLVHTIHAHPTMAEAILEAAHKGVGKPIHSL